MIKLILLSSLILVTICCESSKQNIFDHDEVSFILLNEKNENYLDPQTAIKIDTNDIKLYYINGQGERILQDHLDERGRKITIEMSKDTASFQLTIRINMNDFTHKYAKTIIDIYPYGEIEIWATVEMLPLSAPLGAGGSISYENLYINRKRIPSNSFYTPLKLYF